MKENINNLILNNRGLVVLIANKIYEEVPSFLKKQLNLQDLIEEGSLGLLNAAKAFNPELGFKFSTYAWVSIERQIQKYIKNFQYLNIENLDNFIDEEEETPQELNNKASEIAYIRNFVSHTENMGPKTKEVILLTLEGKSVQEIAHITGTGTKTVQDKIKMGIKKIKWALRK